MSGVLIHIGYPKAGSTYLQNWFSEHPALYYHPKAVAGFYNAHDLARYAQHADKLHEYFVLSSEDLSVWKGDFDVVGFKGKAYDIKQYHHNLSKTLFSIFPHGRVLVVTRGYSSMFKSLYSQYIRGGGILTFRELQQEYGKYFSVLYDYTMLIDIYQQVFGAENVIVLPYELLKENAGTFANTLEGRLNIQHRHQYNGEKVNASLDPKLLTAFQKFSRTLHGAIQPLPYSAQKRIFGYHARQLNFKKKQPLMQFIAKGIKEVEPLEVSGELLDAMRGKAEVLRSFEIFKPYLKDYLLEN